MEKEKKEILLVAKVEDIMERVKRTNGRGFFHFLDPAQQEISKNVIKNSQDIKSQLFGGHEYCERMMLAILPQNEEITIWEWPITVLHIKPKYTNKTLKHSEILGRLMNLGISRDRIGDINITDEFIQIFIAEELKEYVLYNLDGISNASISIKEVGWADVLTYTPPYREVFITVASLRLDGIISKVFSLSRKDSSLLIRSGKVKVNWQLVSNPSLLIRGESVLSVRGKGRATIHNVLGETKKGNIKIVIHINK